MSHCYLNGEIIPAESAQISPFDEGFLAGYGVYETLRSYKGKIINWPAHWQRLQNSLKVAQIQIKQNETELLTATQTLLEKNGPNNQRIRITISAEPTVLIHTTALKLPTPTEYEGGIDLITIPPKRTLPNIKSTSLISQRLIQIALKDHTCFEAIFIDEKGFVLEGSISNIFIIKAGKVFTPLQKDKILPGTTSQLIETFTDVSRVNMNIGVLQEADEVFITNSIIGLLPVKKIDNHPIPLGPITKSLQATYQAWLTTN